MIRREQGLEGLLQRGSLLVGFIDVFQATVLIIASISLLVQFTGESADDFQISTPLQKNVGEILLFSSILGILTGIIALLLAVALIRGILKKSTYMLKAWLIPNCFCIGMAGVVSLICVFTPALFVGIVLSCLFVFRAVECWIVGEVLMDIRSEKQNEQNTFACLLSHKTTLTMP